MITMDLQILQWLPVYPHGMEKSEQMSTDGCLEFHYELLEVETAQLAPVSLLIQQTRITLEYSACLYMGIFGIANNHIL